jgi:hypothetical protein
MSQKQFFVNQESGEKCGGEEPLNLKWFRGEG